MSQALPVAEVRLAQPGVHLHGQAGPLPEGFRGVERATQVGGDDQQRLPLGQHLGGGDGLIPAEVAQLGVELALHAVARVELGLPVSQHHQAADRHGASPSRSTGTIGQSRHKPVQRIEIALVLMLDVHDDVDEVQQCPAAFAGALAACRFVAGQPHLLLDLVDDRVDLTLVGRRRDHEAVGDHQLAGHVDDDDVVGEFGRGRPCGHRRHRDGFVGSGHRECSCAARACER